MNKSCTIRFDGSRYYLGFGACRSRTEYKTFAGAVRSAHNKGYTVETEIDPRIEYMANEKKTKIVTNAISGNLCRIPVNTPACCDPSTETYWSM
jgi:hypothetical protein